MPKHLHNHLTYWLYDRVIQKAIKANFSGRVIDIGCGPKPYKSSVEPVAANYYGFDMPDSAHGLGQVDFVGTAYAIPIQDAAVDGVLCIDVLEHLEEPEMALHETNRVLRNGGKAIFAFPLIWQIHEQPRDFYRYTEYGARHLFEKAGLEVVEIIPVSGFIATFSQMLIYYLMRFQRGILERTQAIAILTYPLQVLAFALDRLDRTRSSAYWTFSYVVIARKAGGK